jgi:hypothetical protein
VAARFEAGRGRGQGRVGEGGANEGGTAGVKRAGGEVVTAELVLVDPAVFERLRLMAAFVAIARSGRPATWAAITSPEAIAGPW